MKKSTTIYKAYFDNTTKEGFLSVGTNKNIEYNCTLIYSSKNKNIVLKELEKYNQFYSQLQNLLKTVI